MWERTGVSPSEPEQSSGFWETVERQPQNAPAPLPPRDPGQVRTGPDRLLQLTLGALLVVVLVSSLAWLFGGPDRPGPVLPPAVDRVRLGQRADELRALGIPLAGAPQDGALVWKTEFDPQGGLSHFSVEAGPGCDGAPVSAAQVAALQPQLQHETLREQVELALGPGLRVQRWIDAQGPVDVLRWEVLAGGRPRGRFEVQVRAGKVISHWLAER